MLPHQPHHIQTQLFAEHLPFANILNLAVQLSSPPNTSTRLTLGDNPDLLVLHHDDNQVTLHLPAALPPDPDFASYLPDPAQQTKILRLQNQTPKKHASSPSEPPWSASSLAHISITCTSCDALFVPSHRIRDWRDLPSDGWADMMDLWHCHKPHDHSTHAASNKGYAADSLLTVKSGLAFVDVLHFLLAEDDCQNLKIEPHEKTSIVRCSQCNQLVGRADRAIKLYKPYLTISAPDSKPVSLPPSIWLSSYLQSRDSGAKRFYTAKSLLELWVFSPRLTYANSLENGASVSEGIKVLYRSITAAEVPSQDELLTRASLLRTELGLPDDLESLMLDQLKTSNAALPLALRMFQQYNVAVLPIHIPI